MQTKRVRNTLIGLLSIAFFTVAVFGTYLEYQLPDVEKLKDIRYQVPLQIFTADGKLIEEFGNKRRVPVSIDQVPLRLIQAILATEDQRFFEHSGVDPKGLLRATVRLIATGTKGQGGSTITMQVARNFFLSRKKTYGRKIREILLALKIDRELSKEKILSLYLNKIFLGHRAYGVGAAAKVYYGTTVDKLTLPQIAMIAGLPKAPSSNNPLTNPVGALKRRNHVLKRMLELGYIDRPTYDAAVAAPVTASRHDLRVTVRAPYVAEMVRTSLFKSLGKRAYTEGYRVYTSLSSELQQAADKALQKALLAYDQRHGYRGALKALPQQAEFPGLRLAQVLSVDEKSVEAKLKEGDDIIIPWSGLSWARKQLNNHNSMGVMPRKASDVLHTGDVIWVSHGDKQTWRLAQVPEVEGAFVALNPNEGAILALVGGAHYRNSQFNRVTQASRQAGSVLKPFIYSAALEKGYTLASVINDAPVVINESNDSVWRPQNDNHRFYGPMRLREALIKSRNLVSIRLLQSIGIPYTRDYLRRFGFRDEQLPDTLSLALGAGTVTPLQLSMAYSVFANGGYQVTPYLIQRIEKWGETVYQVPQRSLEDAPRVVTPQNAYLITSAMKDVITRGTGRRARVLHRRVLAGKTGTTNDQIDGWFAGFTPNLVAVSWVGFDEPRSLYEYGSKAALPMWISFMKEAMPKLQAKNNFPRPDDIVSVRIDPVSGRLADNTQKHSIFEVFRQAYKPSEQPTNVTAATAAPEPNTDSATELF